MPSQPGPINGKQYALEWVHIDDFSPGCYDGSNISTLKPTLTTAPLGAADISQTFSCTSIVGGALAPLPAVVTTTDFSFVDSIPGGSPYALITGFIITPQLNSGGYETVILYEADNGTDHYVRAWSLSSAGPVNAITGPTETTATTAGFFGSPYPAFTRMTASGSGNPSPVLVFPTAVATDGNSTSGHLWVYPTLSAPTGFVAEDLNASVTSVTGQVICYGNRVICMAGIDYSWPLGSGINTNENFNYTNPPESAIYGSQETILGIERPWGYGAWGTISVGELLLVKKYGGAVILNGDINTPTSVIPIPGIQSTGDLVGSACPTPIGLVYCAQNQGAWVWNGGNSSQKISKNLNDDFFDLQTHAITSNNYGFFVYFWQKWVMFSNNIILDTDTNSWWKFYPNSGQGPGSVGRDIFWYCLTQNGNQLAAAPLKVTNASQPLSTIFDNTVPSSFYQWQSLPIHVTKNADRVIDIRQVVVRVSDPTNTGDATIELTVNGTVVATSTETIGLVPEPIRFNVGVEGVDDIIINLFANNTGTNGSAPIVHSIDVGYQVRAGVGVND